MRCRRLAVLLLLIAPAGMRAQSSPTVSKFDPGLTVAVDINKIVRLDLATGREKNEDSASARWRAAGGISFRIKPFRKTLFDLIDTDKQHRYVLGIGYEFSRTTNTDRTEHRLLIDGTLRYTLLARVLLTNRSRFELRWVDNGFHFRYRNRLMFERPIKLNRFKLTRRSARPRQYGTSVTPSLILSNTQAV